MLLPRVFAAALAALGLTYVTARPLGLWSILVGGVAGTVAALALFPREIELAKATLRGYGG